MIVLTDTTELPVGASRWSGDCVDRTLSRYLRSFPAAARLIALIAAFGMLAPQLVAKALPPETLARIDYEQRLGAKVPQDIEFRDETGAPVRLGDFFQKRPVVLALVYYECPSLCTVVLNGTLESMRNLRSSAGKDFEVVVVSIKPGDSPQRAAQKKQDYVRRYARIDASNGWHFLCGDAGSIGKLADTVGFHYALDPASGEYAHPSGIVVLTPQGTVSRYLLGIEFPPKQLQAALEEASREQVGSFTSRLLLLCFKYDPNTGRYTPIIRRILQAVGVSTVLFLGGMILYLSRSEWRLRKDGGS